MYVTVTYFVVLRFCIISGWLFDVWTSLFGIMIQYDPTLDLKINVGHWPIFHGQMILPNTLKIDVWTSLFGIRSRYDPPEVWPQNKYRSLWSIFHGSVILLYILKTIWCMNIILWDYGLVWPTFDLKINVGLCDLYFMVQWFCLISPRLFDTWVSYFQTMRQCDPNFDLKVYINQHDIYIYVNMTYISWSSDFA